jgi:hypothetical protein
VVGRTLAPDAPDDTMRPIDVMHQVGLKACEARRNMMPTPSDGTAFGT